MNSVFCLFVVTMCAATIAAADPFEMLGASKWVWKSEQIETCEEGAYYSVSQDRKTIWVEKDTATDVRGTLTKRAKYQVIGYGETYIDMFLELETWRDSHGKLVTWRLQFLDDGRFVWIRSDWERGRSTKPNWPCKFSS